jgi:hypothetical protein
MSFHVEIKTISAHFIWIMGLLEAITVPLVVMLPFWTRTALKNPLHGILVGFAGVMILFYFLNLLMARLNLLLRGAPVTSISVFPSALWSGLILALIFGIQYGLKAMIALAYPIREILLGFLSAGGAIALTGLLYRVSASRWPFLAVKIQTRADVFRMDGFSVRSFSLWSGVYESVALPIILVWTFCAPHQGVAAIATGLAGGLVGGAFIWVASRMVVNSVWISLKKLPAGATRR